jgi:hypothetical protein
MSTGSSLLIKITEKTEPGKYAIALRCEDKHNQAARPPVLPACAHAGPLPRHAGTAPSAPFSPLVFPQPSHVPPAPARGEAMRG